jgi:hypothetical protein
MQLPERLSLSRAVRVVSFILGCRDQFADVASSCDEDVDAMDILSPLRGLPTLDPGRCRRFGENATAPTHRAAATTSGASINHIPRVPPYATDDGKTEAGAFLPRRHIGLEQPVAVFLRQACAVVDPSMRLLPSRAPTQIRPRRVRLRAPRRRLGGVLDDVGEPAKSGAGPGLPSIFSAGSRSISCRGCRRAAGTTWRTVSAISSEVITGWHAREARTPPCADVVDLAHNCQLHCSNTALSSVMTLLGA